MAHGDLIDGLIDALRCLPGVGPRTAQRMTWHLLERNRDAGRRLAAVLADAMDRVGHCRECRTLTEQDLCPVCASPRRDRARICVVENPADVVRIEAGTDYRGVYFVLMGNLSPLDGIGPGDLGLDQLATPAREWGCGGARPRHRRHRRRRGDGSLPRGDGTGARRYRHANRAGRAPRWRSRVRGCGNPGPRFLRPARDCSIEDTGGRLPAAPARPRFSPAGPRPSPR